MKKKLKKIDRVVKGLSDRYFPAAFAISDDLTKKLNLPPIIQKEAMSIYKKIDKKLKEQLKFVFDTLA